MTPDRRRLAELQRDRARLLSRCAGWDRIFGELRELGHGAGEQLCTASALDRDQLRRTEREISITLERIRSR